MVDKEENIEVGADGENTDGVGLVNANSRSSNLRRGGGRGLSKAQQRNCINQGRVTRGREIVIKGDR